MGDSMTAISLGQTAHRGRLGMMAKTAAIKFGQLTNDSDGYSVGPAQVREQFEEGNVTARSQEVAGGFVDFLLGRGARHPRGFLLPVHRRADHCWPLPRSNPAKPPPAPT